MEWKTIDNKLYRKFKLKDFRSAVAFIQLIAFEAEKMDHHPEICNVYNMVEIRLSTHSAGNVVTALDERLAAAIDEIYNTYFA